MHKRRRHQMKKLIIYPLALILILATVIFTACSDNISPKDKTFYEIVSEITGEEILTSGDLPIYFTIGDDDSYCEIDTNPFDFDNFSSGIARNYIKEMNKLLGLPDYLYNDMLNTSYLQGKQEETFDKIKVKYYYHPDKGLNVSYYRI